MCCTSLETISVLQRNITNRMGVHVPVCIIYSKELANLIIGAGKSEICRTGW